MTLKARAQIAAMLFIPVLTGCVVVPKRSVKAPNPDTALRAIFQRQIQGAFDPLTDDPQVRSLKTRLTLEPNDVTARLGLAAIYERYSFLDEARTQYTTALRNATASQAEQAILGVARCAQGFDGIKEVIPVLEGFLKEWASAAAWNQLGLLYDQIGNLAGGEAAFREALTLDGKPDSIHNNLGHNLLLQNKLETAEVELRKALELNSKSATTRNNLGVVLARRGDLQGAFEQFSSVADAAAAHNNLAVVLLETGQYEQSRDELVKALMIRQYFAPALANFKLVQEKIRERTELQKQVPLSAEKGGGGPKN